jgi:hypothetical protein
MLTQQQENLRVRFNSDSGTNYARHYLGGNGSSAFAAGTPNETYALTILVYLLTALQRL